MPLRDDFERDYDNGCETLVSQLNIGSVEDEDIDMALKLAHVDMYVQRQRERARRKRVVRDYQLPATFFEDMKKEALLQVPGGARAPRRRKDKGRTLADRLRTLGQFLTRAEYQQFHDNLQAEKDLVYRIKELMRYRRNGITKIADCVEFERARARRQTESDDTKTIKRRKRLRFSRPKDRKSRYWRYILAQRALLDKREHHQQHQQQHQAR